MSNGGLYAGKEDCRAGAQGRARRKVAFHTGWRIRSRRDRARAGGKARRAERETGDCDWALQSTARGSEAAAAEERIRGHESAGPARYWAPLEEGRSGPT